MRRLCLLLGPLSFAATATLTGAQAAMGPFAGTWYEFTGQQEVSINAGNSYAIVMFQYPAGNGSVYCIYAMDLVATDAPAILVHDSDLAGGRSAAECSAQATISLAAADAGLEATIAMGSVTLESKLERTSYVRDDGRTASNATFDINGLKISQSDADILGVMNAMPGAYVYSFQSDFKDSSAHLYYNVSQVTPDVAEYETACDVGNSSGQSVENNYVTIAGLPSPGAPETVPVVINRYFVPLDSKRPLMTTMNDALAKKYGEPTGSNRWVYDPEGLLYKVERITENGRDSDYAITRDAEGKIVNKVRLEDGADRLCDRGQSFPIESKTGMFQCGDRKFDYAPPGILGYGRSIDIAPEPYCGAVLEVDIDSEGDYLKNARFTGWDVLAGNLVMGTIFIERIDAVMGRTYRELAESSKTEVVL